MNILNSVTSSVDLGNNPIRCGLECETKPWRHYVINFYRNIKNLIKMETNHETMHIIQQSDFSDITEDKFEQWSDGHHGDSDCYGNSTIRFLLSNGPYSVLLRHRNFSAMKKEFNSVSPFDPQTEGPADKDVVVKKNVVKKLSGRHFVLGVSGGADSMLLLNLCLSCINSKYLHVVQCEHGVRETRSVLESEWVEEYCKINNVDFYGFSLGMAGVPCGHDSKEGFARILRQKCFEYVATKFNAFIFTGHNKTDRAESIFFHIIRGTGISGVKGFLPLRTSHNGFIYVKPIIDLTRNEIRAIMENNCFFWCEDETNEATEFTRNKIRNIIFPFIQEQINPKLIDHLCALGDEATDIYNQDLKSTEQLLNILTHRSASPSDIER